MQPEPRTAEQLQPDGTYETVDVGGWRNCPCGAENASTEHIEGCQE